ncbi:MAG: AbrB/MazE/SpoVT family DNA-binding domain-containing protein [Ignavibacteria bacterium]|nr:AbrB/MazE/SpoVT family DNA-binding domain-containing protein [Ignavibacteria bacterium]
MKSIKLTTNGRVTVPAELRKKYNLNPGTRVNLVEDTNGIIIIPVTHKTIRANVGFLGIKGKSLLKALMEEKKIEREL